MPLLHHIQTQSQLESMSFHFMRQPMKTFRISPIRFLLMLVAMVSVAVISAGHGLGQDTQSDSEVRPQISIGIDGHIRLGKWAPVFIKYDSTPTTAPVNYEITVLDGDDAPITYNGELTFDPENPNLYQGLARIGRGYGGAELRLLDAGGKTIENFKLPFRGENKVATVIQSTRSMIATIEPASHFKSAIESYSLVGQRDDSPIVARLGSELPASWLGYDGVETVLMVTSDLDLMKSISDRQIEALKVWVRNGGTQVVSAAKNAPKIVAKDGPLASFCPGTYTGSADYTNSKRLETFANSEEQLVARRGEPIPIASLNDIDGKVLLDAGKQTPLIVSRAMALGEVVFVGIDLDSDRIMQWEGGNNLVGRLVTLNQFSGEIDRQEVKGTSISTYGYEDIVGQLRVPLDRFSNVKFVAFTWIALLIGLYILCIGPGDFFFLKKLLKKMELTWITFPLLSLLFCGLAVAISQMTRPTSIQINQLEIIDIDTVDGRTRGSVWANLYSPSGGSRNIQIDSKHNLGFEIDSDVLTWHGLPGDGLGGMWSSPTPGLSKTGYRQTIELGEQQQTNIAIESLPLQVSSTKPMFGQWWSDSNISRTSRLTSQDGRLTGTVTNPLPYQLKNCRLIFENWAYILDAPMDEADTVDVRTETDEKTLRALMTRKFKKLDEDNRSNNTAWNPTDTNTGRIASMMMFYQAAGGNNYTGLTHRYQSFTDMSHNLFLKRAVLVGEIDGVGAELLVDAERVSDNYDHSRTIVRIILPVKIK